MNGTKCKETSSFLSASTADASSLGQSCLSSMPGCVGEVTNTCLLMTSEERYYLYKYEFTPEGQLTFTRPSLSNGEKPSKPIVYDLHVTQVCTIDREDKKVYCNDKRHYGINILQKSSRKVYFVSYEKMISFKETALRLQGFSSARDQFKFLEKIF